MKYRKKPVEVDAEQWDGTIDSANLISEIFEDMQIEEVTLDINGFIKSFEIITLEGKHAVSPNDFIIKGVKGEFYPCKPDIFEMTYDKVD